MVAVMTVAVAVAKAAAAAVVVVVRTAKAAGTWAELEAVEAHTSSTARRVSSGHALAPAVFVRQGCRRSRRQLRHFQLQTTKLRSAASAGQHGQASCDARHRQRRLAVAA